MNPKVKNPFDDGTQQTCPSLCTETSWQLDLSACHSLYQKALEISSSQPDQTMILLEVCLQALQAAAPKSQQHYKLLAECAFELARRYRQSEQEGQAVCLYQKSLQTLLELPDYDNDLNLLNQAANCAMNLSWIYLDQEEEEASILYTEQALEIHERVAALSDTIRAFTRLAISGYFHAAMVFHHFKRDKQALFYLQKSLERQEIITQIYRAVQIHEGLANSYALQARIYTGLNDYPKAFSSRLKAIEVFKNLAVERRLNTYRKKLAKAYHLAGQAALKALQPQQAEALLLKRIDIHIEDFQKNPDKNNRNLLAKGYQDLASLYQTLNQLENSQKAQELAALLLEEKREN